MFIVSFGGPSDLFPNLKVGLPDSVECLFLLLAANIHSLR